MTIKVLILGMGAYSPLPQLSSAVRQQMIDEVLKPTIDGLVAGEYHYHGIFIYWPYFD